MELQKKILKQYMQLKSKPTLKEVANDTGIQLTRVFRLLNGAPMKLEEFQIFQKRVKELSGLTSTLEEVAYECALKLSVEAVKELELFLIRKIEIWKLTQISLPAIETQKAI